MKASDIEDLANLARIDINNDTAIETAKSISQILTLVDQLQSADTHTTAPMAHPMDAVQRLRRDTVTETPQRDALQANAPATQDGLFLVPQVIE